MVPRCPPKQPRLDAHCNLYTSVLTSTDLIAVVTAFQGGIFDDMRPFVRQASYADWSEYFRYTSTHNVCWSDFTGIGDCLDSWLCSRSVDDVPLLVMHLPRLRDLLAMVAIQRASLSLVRAIDISRCQCLVIRAGVQQACRIGSVPLLKIVFPHHMLPWQYFDEECLVQGRSVDVVAYFSDIEAPIFSLQTMDSAASHNCLPIVEWLHLNRNEGCTTAAMDFAAANGHLEIVQFLHLHRPEGCTTFAMDRAAANGHLAVVQFLHKHRTEGCTTSATDWAALHGHLEVVQFLHEHRTEGCTLSALDVAAKNGHLEIVRFLHEHRTEGCSSDAMDGAAARGHLEIVRFLHEHRTEGCSSDAMDGAAARGHLEIVQFLHENRTEGCTTNAMARAGRSGHLEVVRWLNANRTEGCTQCD
ncbi:Aste57867_1751 [Aphanomyces stellatus]|uniref:Aste57867_1751 protein n=1 Tax=Aphanomyces stellatus TaxID=120398 RepID=A0A485K760_9STRA|nr:hypothetical protein As57867_001749 [Aphanomyces stellatus]VFT78961.1 Aste57867_1751 [Aphanomyces stellatus]